MANPPESPGAQPRPRTATRLRFVAPPGWSAPTTEGAKTIGRYEITKTLGKGAMGVVYQARDPLLDRIVAVKTIVSPRSRGGRVRNAFLERFEREAKAAAKMQHPAIVTIFDVGTDGSAPFMVLEYLPGESLADRLDRIRMPLGKAIQIALDLASALGFAHDKRIVHRDVKPANVLHAGHDRWKLADFGIARMPNSDLTQVGIFMGTPGYVPPEAISRGQYTPQADVFAWGAVLYELLSGRIPYEGPDTRTTNGYVLKKTAVNPRTYDKSIPEPIAEVVMTALEASTKRRYKTGTEAESALRSAWEHCLNSGVVSPKALISTEIPHDKVGKMMHATESAVRTRREVAGSPGKSAAHPSIAEVGFLDDAPTRIVKMEGDDVMASSGMSASSSGVGGGVGTTSRVPMRGGISTHKPSLAPGNGAVPVQDTDVSYYLSSPLSKQAQMWLWALSIFVVLVAVTLAALYFSQD